MPGILLEAPASAGTRYKATESAAMASAARVNALASPPRTSPRTAHSAPRGAARRPVARDRRRERRAAPACQATHSGSKKAR